MADQRDGWAKADILIKAVASIGLPLVLFVVGQEYNRQQQRAAEAARRLERLSSLIGPLSSDNARTRRVAIEVAGYLAKAEQLPPELVPVLLTIAREDPSAATAQAATTALAAAEQANPQLRSQIEADVKSAPARVYVHVNDEAQRDRAQALGATLVDALGGSVVVPGIERVNGPRASELRYFRTAEAEEAGRIAKALQDLGVEVAIKDLSARYENAPGMRPRHFELWLGNDFPAGGAAPAPRPR